MAERIEVAILPTNSEQSAPQAPPQLAPEQVAQQSPAVDQLNELGALRLELAKLKEELAAATVSRARDIAIKPNDGKAHIGRQDATRERLIRELGNSRYHSLSPDERLRVQGYGPATAHDMSEAPKFFGRTSNAADAARLLKSDPQRYARLRVIAREHGIF